MLDTVAVLYHPHRERAVSEAKWLASTLQERGVQVRIGNGWDRAEVVRLGCGTDLAVALGGDGTIIHVAKLLTDCDVPLLGVNLGRVGFLAEMTPAEMRDRVDTVAEGKFWTEARTMLDVMWEGDEGTQHFLSLNEVVVARGGTARAVHVRTRLDGDDFMTYTADGVLVATATGSTAYSLAAGGPILYPEAAEFMLTPVAPHLHIGRSIILPPDMQVELSVSSDIPAVLSVDGADERTLEPEQRVSVRRSDQVARFARFCPRMYFYDAIAARLR